MRIGSFVFPVSHYPYSDSAVIDSTLDEIEFAERIGLDAVWLTEHHFDGAVVYADPLVFGAAVAARTKRVKIGFAVVELALHHPVRLAVQTSILDNLSHGRLIVGTGRGSAFNHYEYIGYGIDMQDGIDRLDEGEELLVKAWTDTPLKHEGEHWQMKFPMLRPRPYQKPHPPLIRACISEASSIAMGRIGRPIMLGILPLDDLMGRLNAFRDTMLESGYDERTTAATFDQCWASRNVFVAESYEEAREMAEYGFARERRHFGEARRLFNPGGGPTQQGSGTSSARESLEMSFIMGTPSQVAEELMAFKDAGIPNLMLKFNTGQMEPQRVQASMRLFGEKVMPLLRKI